MRGTNTGCYLKLPAGRGIVNTAKEFRPDREDNINMEIGGFGCRKFTVPVAASESFTKPADSSLPPRSEASFRKIISICVDSMQVG